MAIILPENDPMKDLSARPLAALLFALVASFPAVAADANVSAATLASQAWLAEIDQARYGESWDDAAKAFRDVVPKSAWVTQAKAVREPLGAVVHRELKTATFTHTLPGAPDGDYVVIQYDTQFAQKAHAVETVTPQKAANGAWHVSGYYIR
jgi:hypothetical protein